MSPLKEFPTDPLERSQHRWVDLFFGVLEAIRKHDRNLAFGIMLALEEAGLAEYHGDLLAPISGLFELNPSDDILRKTSPFRLAASIPPLRGRVKHGRARPPYLFILMQYYKALFEQKSPRSPRKLQGEEPPHERAVRLAAKNCGYGTAAFRKHLERARELYPDLTRLWKGKGAQWIKSS